MIKQHARRLAATWSGLKKLEMLSANLAIGTASAFVLVTAAASLAVDRDVGDRDMGRAPANVAWSLRGSLAPADKPLLHAGRDARKVRLSSKTLVAWLH